MTPPARHAPRITPGAALRWSLVAWGLGHLLLGRRRPAAALFAAEVIGLAVVAAATVAFSDTTWYLLSFVLGCAFIGAWVAEATWAYRTAQRMHGAVAPAAPRSPAAAITWLALPLLAWGTGFWLFAGQGSSAAAVLDRFLTRWPSAGASAGWGTDLSTQPDQLRVTALSAIDRLRVLCDAKQLSSDCGAGGPNLLRAVRIRIADDRDETATAVAEAVRYVRRPSLFFGMVAGTEIVPVADETVLTLRLSAQPAVLGARRWTIVSASAG